MKPYPILIKTLVVAGLLLGSVSIAVAQKKNGKVTIEIEKGGVEKGRIKNGLREGTWKSYNAAGKPIKEENYLHGKRDGVFTQWTDSSVVTGNYTAGQKNGAFITKYNGHLVSEINYKMDTLHGKYFLDSREKFISASYNHGKKDGLRVVDSVDYERHHVRDSTNYKNGLRDGVSVLYVNNVRVQLLTWSEGKRNGAFREYDPKSGAVITSGAYRNDNRDGYWLKYKDGRLISREDFENGIHASNSFYYGTDTSDVTGTESYYPDGMKKVSQQNYPGGKASQRIYFSQQGNIDSIVSYFTDGRIKDAHYTAYVNNEGITQFYTYQSYYMNGKVKQHGYEHKNERDGNWLTYDSTGKLLETEHYVDGKPFGWFIAYYPGGGLKLKAYCYEGITDTILVYAKAGAKLSQKDPMYSKTIAEVQAIHPDIQFRDPNTFPPDHHRKGVVALGPDANEGTWSDEPATFPGGNDSLNSFIQRTISFPEPERRMSKEGEVHIKFLVEKDGSLSDIQIVKEVQGAPGFTKETMRLMRVMPKWTPARTDGKIVRVYYILPVKFSLQ